MDSNFDVLESAIKKAKSIGADHVDIISSESENVSVNTRLTKLEKLIEAKMFSSSIRVCIGKKYATISCDNIDTLKDNSFIEKVVYAAQNSPEETDIVRADVSDLCKNFATIDMCDETFKVDPEKLIFEAKKCEDIALQVKGITNSEGAETSYSCGNHILMRDDGFVASYKKSRHQISVITIAEKDGNLERDYAYSCSVYNSDLKKPEEIAKDAAEKTLKRLGAKKIQSCKVPVVFNHDTSRQLLGKLLEALDGANVARGMSFLKDKLHQKIFSDNFSITDRYAINRGLRSRPFDSDGLECRDTNLITNGELNSFILNTKYAHKLAMKSTANASGWTGISPNNICVENGKESFETLIKNINNGLYVTDVLGNGLNVVNGNYSQGAVGFWIENGELTYPVNEITVAGNFAEMFSHCNVASDLKIEFGIDSPTIFFDEMVVGGI